MQKQMKTEMLYVRSMAPHYHQEELEILLVLRGSLVLQRMERRTTLEEGQFTFINRGIVHHIESEGAYVLSTRIMLREFTHIFDRIEYVEFLNGDEYEKDPVRPLRDRFQTVIMDFVIRDYLLRDNPRRYEEKEFNENQLMYFLFVNYQMANVLSKGDANMNPELLNRFYMIAEYISVHIHERIMVEDILKLVYMNPAYFSQFMKRVGGIPFKEYLSYRKLMRITALLLEREMPMTEIAASVDLTDMKAFYHMFKKKYGTSPAKWREYLKSIPENCRKCTEEKVLEEFTDKYRYYKHRENSLARTYRYINACMKNEISLKDVEVTLDPYADMCGVQDEDYQPYKYAGALFRLVQHVGAQLILSYSMSVLRKKSHEDLLMLTLQGFMTSYGISGMRSWKIVLRVGNNEELECARRLKKRIMKEVGLSNIRISLIQ